MSIDVLGCPARGIGTIDAVEAIRHSLIRIKTNRPVPGQSHFIPVSLIGSAYQDVSRANRIIRTLCQSSDVERSEEHTSELQSRLHLVCRLLLEKKKQI